MKHISYIDDFDTWKREFSFYITVSVRFSETDMFGHMNNISPFIYFEQARIEYFKQAGFTLWDREDEHTEVPIVADLQCDFHQQVFFDDQINIYVKVNHIGTSSLDIHYMCKNQHDEICLTGRGALVYIEARTGKPVAIPEHIKDLLLSE